MNLKSYKVAFTLSLIVILVLCFFLYSQWVKSTNMYMKSHTDLESYVAATRFHIHMYLENGDTQHLDKAYQYADAAARQSQMFKLYFPNQLGRELSNNLNTIFRLRDFYVEDNDKTVLEKRIHELDEIMEHLNQGNKPQAYGGLYVNNVILPMNPYTKQKAKRVLETTEVILMRRGE